jgi:subtilase family serine protease
MTMRTPIARRRQVQWIAALLLVPVLLAGCSVRVANNVPDETPTTTTATTARTPAAGGPCPTENASGGRGYTPRQLRTAYGVESLCQQGYTGKGQTAIVIVSYGSPTLQQDVDAFSQRFGLPKLTVDVRAPIGTAPFDATDQDMQGWAEETTLDVEMIHAIAPDAKVVVLTSPVDETEGTAGLPEFLQLEQYARDNHLGQVVNQSWDASEISLNDTAGRDEVAQYNAFYQDATTQQGLTFVAASGDSGATDYASAADYRAGKLSHTPTAGFPTDSPWVVSVGGTTLQVGNGAQVSETAWNSNGGASGGGFSMFNAEPSYQRLLPSSDQSQLANRRGVPDVAATADPSTALDIYVNGRIVPIGGTSAASPLWAGILLIADQMAGHPLGFVNPALYKVGTSAKAAQDFRDITSGNNSMPSAGVQGYQTASGWDPVTGLGAPVADHLLPDLIAAASAA